MHVVFRVDSGTHIGSGHLIRCLTLANELSLRDIHVTFIMREHEGHLIVKVVDAGYEVSRISHAVHSLCVASNDYIQWLGVSVEQDATDTLNVISSMSPDMLIVDHYSLDIRWERIVRPFVSRIMVIDDLANRNHDCDFLLDQNYFSDNTVRNYNGLVPDRCRLMLGPKFALLQPEYYKLRCTVSRNSTEIQKILVYFGGSDLSNQTEQVLKALSDPMYQRFLVNVVIGGNHPDSAGIKQLVECRQNTKLYQNIDSLAQLMFSADLMIGAGGSTTWERMCLGLPALVVAVAENQRAISQDLAENGYQFMLPQGALTTAVDWRLAITALLKDANLIKKVVGNAKKLVDGLGAKRVARIILGHFQLDVAMRKASIEDEDILFDWANDPFVRKNSFQQKPISLIEHQQWFSRKINDPNYLILIAEDEAGLPIGQVRFEFNPQLEQAHISINLDSLFRGMGLSKVLLSKAIAYWRLFMPRCKKIIAEVKFENEPSKNLFLKLNFKEVQHVSRGERFGYVFELIC